MDAPTILKRTVTVPARKKRADAPWLLDGPAEPLGDSWIRFLTSMQMQEALDRCEYAIRHQQDEIARLRAELKRRDEELTQLLAWIDGDSDALVTLQRTYMDPRISTSDRIKAAGAAIAYERPKLSVQVRVGPSVLSERLARARSIKAAEPKTIEHSSPDAA